MSRRSQVPVKNGRVSMGAGLIAAIEREVEKASRRFGVSRSWVIADALADYFGISQEDQIRYNRREHHQHLKVVGGRGR